MMLSENIMRKMKNIVHIFRKYVTIKKILEFLFGENVYINNFEGGFYDIRTDIACKISEIYSRL